jgi:hypothetical protein
MIDLDDVPVPARPGLWEEIYVAQVNNGLAYTAPTTCGTTECGHAAGSYHYICCALDRGACGNDPDRLFRLLEPHAQGANRVVDELFYDPIGGYKRGVWVGAIGNHGPCSDPNGHLHAAIRPGYHLPAHVLYPGDSEEQEIMGAAEDIKGHVTATGWVTNVTTIKQAKETRQTVRKQIDQVLNVLDLVVGALVEVGTDTEKIQKKIRELRQQLDEAEASEPSNEEIEAQAKQLTEQ